MTTTTHQESLSYSWKRAVAPVMLLVLAVGNFFVRIFEAFIEARRLQAAFDTAHHLKTHNKDFKNMTYHEVVQFILNDTTKGKE